MDQSIVAVEENNRRNDTMASTSKPLGALVHINSIAIDISCAVEEIEEPPMHEHFSIRGFVAGVRKKDWKICLPFDSDNDETLMDNLPPLSIPKSRWWQCSHCVPDISNKEKPTQETLLETRNDPGTSSCPDVNGQQDVLFLPNIQRTKGNEHEPREDDSGPTNNKVINSGIRSNEKYEATTSSREKIDAKDNGGNTRTSVAEANPLQIQDMCQKSADASDAVHVNEVDNASSGSEGSFNVSAHRKKRKLRSLADIMYEEKNSTTGEQSRNLKSATSSGTQAKSTDAEGDLDPEFNLDMGKCTKTQKRKGAVEEERVASEMTSPAKKQKGTVPENAEKACRRFQLSDSESEGNASVRLDVRQNAKISQAKPKKKTRQAHVDIKTALFALQKHNVASSGADFGFITMGAEKEQYFAGFPSEKHMDRISYLSKGKRPVVESDHGPNLMAPQGKSILSDQDIRREVALDLSLNSCVDGERNADGHMSFRQPSSIPDLNVSFTEKTMQGKQLPMVSEKRSLVPSKTSSEMLPTCSKEMTREARRKPGISQPQTVQNINTTIESGGVSDDFPMEIVELLAKNKRERTLGNSRQHQISREAFHNSPIQRPSPVYLDGHPSSFNFPPRSTVAFNEMGISRSILNFPPSKNSGTFDHSHFRLFNSFTPNRPRKMPFPSRNPIGPPRPVEGMDRSDLLWPPRSKNVPFHISVPPNCSIPNSSLNVQPTFPDHCYKGKPINDFKGKGKIGSGHKSLDAYSNDAIPAMQLLSLVDRGIVSGSSFKVGKNSFLDKPFSPCSHHPRLNGNENTNGPFFNASSFPQSSQGKNFPGLLNGVCFPSESLKKPYLRDPIFAGHQEPGQQLKGIQFNNPAKAGTIPPSRDNLQLGPCTLNRNPADFSIPEANNEFTITAKDLKPRKRTTLKEKPHFPTMESQKRQRAKKDAPGKDLPRK